MCSRRFSLIQSSNVGFGSNPHLKGVISWWNQIALGLFQDKRVLCPMKRYCKPQKSKLPAHTVQCQVNLCDIQQFGQSSHVEAIRRKQDGCYYPEHHACSLESMKFIFNKNNPKPKSFLSDVPCLNGILTVSLSQYHLDFAKRW